MSVCYCGDRVTANVNPLVEASRLRTTLLLVEGDYGRDLRPAKRGSGATAKQQYGAANVRFGSKADIGEH